ncbi:uncharacterized protein LOC129582208 [Paramacrobiotus metropolitanus]|uniref:uncharacterized protein LOC129582208 n=1 Tax=Paramacrobiotus metropolitanus TaxID=2943436 RepID=UPI002445F8AB|nr:uncharacterized protein LOC129582208 [Paramacrobiotus metropolitanus]
MRFRCSILFIFFTFYFASCTMNSVFSLFVLLIVLHGPLGYAYSDNKKGQFTAAMPEEFPVFSTEPMTHDQCGMQFTANCQPNYTDYFYTRVNCTQYQGLAMFCNASASATEIHQLAVSLSQPPLRAMDMILYDSEELNFETVAPVRKSTVILELRNCVSARATGKLYELGMPNLLDFTTYNCYDLVVKKVDFWHSLRLRMIQFANSTLQYLEKGTFTDLPGLRLLSMDGYLDQMEVFNDDLQDYLKRLHCGCDYAWLRQFLSTDRLLIRNITEGDTYAIRTNSHRNAAAAKRELYLPVDCAADPFPLANNSIDFTQERFSVNEDPYVNKWRDGCKKDKFENEAFPDFSLETMTPEECAVQAECLCAPSDIPYTNCTASPNAGLYQIVDTDCNNESSTKHIRRVTTAIAKLPLRATSLLLFGKSPITFSDIAPVRRQIVLYTFMNCTSPRDNDKLRQLVFPNLLEYNMWHCADLVVKKSDFQYSPKLRDITFYNTTIRALDGNAFASLPDLRILSIEFDMTDVPFDGRIRDYLFRLHCSCEFAGFRRWWSNNTALLRSAEDGEVFSPAGSWSSTYERPWRLYLPVDCAKVKSEDHFVDFNATSFSLNEPACE